MNKLYIITNSTFPFGNANSNYLRYFALALKNVGWDVSVIGSNLSGKCEAFGEFEGINFKNITLKNHRLPFHITDHLFYADELKAAIKEANIQKEDYVFVYSMYMDIVKTALKELDLEKGHLSIGMVEWFMPFQYRFGTLNPDYICWKHTFSKLVTKYPKVLPISENLSKYYKNAGCETMVLPIMADTENNKNDSFKVKKDGVYNFIYPGDAGKKDTFDGIIEALNKLSDEELKKLKFHVTLLKEKTVEKIAKSKNIDSDRIKKCFVFHGRLEYSKLLELYNDMDFLFIAREKNTVTISNFPSKIPELMSYNIVPVCSKVGDYADFYLEDRKDSIIFDGCDCDACFDGIKRAISLSDDELLEMKKNARKCVEEKFDYHNWSEKIAEFLTK